jgi:hypothetical protein
MLALHDLDIFLSHSLAGSSAGVGFVKMPNAAQAA